MKIGISNIPKAITPKKSWRVRTWFVFGIFSLIALWAVVYSVDIVFASSGKNFRNTEVYGTDFGGLSKSDTIKKLEQLAQIEGQRPITLVLPTGEEIKTTFEAVGLQINQSATALRIKQSRENDIVSWTSSLFETMETSPVYEVSLNFELLENNLGLPFVVKAPTTPKVEKVNPYSPFTMTEGRDGEVITAQSVIFSLQAKVAEGISRDAPPIISVDSSPLSPTITNTQALLETERVNRITSTGIDIVHGELVRRLSAEKYREAVSGQIQKDSQQLVWDIDSEILHRNIEELMADQYERGEVTGFQLSEDGQSGEILFINGKRCCSSLKDKAFDSFKIEQNKIAVVELKTDDSLDEEYFANLGIGDLIAESITYHASDDERITNIQRMADLTKGVVIEPGEVWSLNNHVGEMTEQKGFISSLSFYTDSFNNTVGSGASQYATTLFNAAFFAGLDFRQHQSHSIHFNNYPYGRDAYISHPWPDLVLQNKTPYGMLIWPTYDETSISVRIYSTPYFRVGTAPQRISSNNDCTYVTTTRIRTYPDGRQDYDEIYATYRSNSRAICQ